MRRRIVGTLWVAAVTMGWGSLALACEVHVAPETLRRAAEDVWEAFARLDPPGVEAARVRLEAQLRCGQARLSPAQARAWHRARLAEAYVDGEQAALSATLGALRALDPAWTPRPFPTDHLLFELWSDLPATAEPSSTRWVPQARAVKGWVDGTRWRSGALPEGRAFVLETRTRWGTRLHRGHHASPAEVPASAYEPWGPEPAAARARRRGGRLAAGVGGGVLVATGVGLAVSAQLRAEGTGSPGHVRQVAAGYGLAGVGLVGLAMGWTAPW